MWTHVLRLIGMIIVADGRVYREEVAEFVVLMAALSKAVSPDMVFGEKMAFDWFVAHRKELLALAKSPDFERKALQEVLALKKERKTAKAKILHSMWAVAAADDKHHDVEIDIITLAAAHWDLPNPYGE